VKRAAAILGILHALVLGGLAQTPDDHNEGSKLEWDSANSIWRFKWWGRQGRTYFIQHSDNLLDPWQWVPAIESGNDSVREWGFTTTGDKFFVRLKCSDIPTTDPSNADFDGDGVPNLFEVLNGFNPFGLVDAAANGMPDEWEMFFVGKFAIWPPSLSASIPRNQTANRTIHLRNDTASPVQFSVALSGNSGPAYSFEDSITGGAVYEWEEISATGIRFAGISDAYSGQETINLTSFSFPFYGAAFNSVHVSVKGALTLGQAESIYDNYYPLPSQSAPRNLVAAFLDDLDTRTIGDIYYKAESDRLIVQYENVCRSYDPNSACTFQIVLFADGRIAFRYKAMAGTLNSATIGIQDAAGTTGLQIANNTAYVAGNMAVEIRPQSSFLSVAPAYGTVAPYTTLSLGAVFRSMSLPFGSYSATVTTSHDAAVVAGPHVMTATLEVFNAPAQISLTAPLDKAVFLEGEEITLTASATDTDGMQKVGFFQGATLLAEDSWPSYQYYLGFPPPGDYVLRAKATDVFGGETFSTAATITVLPDADRDGLPDGWEADNGLSSGDFSDSLADSDGDRIPNLWEYRHGTDPNDGLSRAATARVVAANGSGDHLSLQEAYDAASDGDVIEVREGTYAGLYTGDSKRLVWLAAPTSPSAIVEITPSYPSWRTTIQTYADAAFDGFSIKGNGGMVAYVGSGRAAFTNCRLSGGVGDYSPGAIQSGYDTTVFLEHCTLIQNRSDDHGSGWGANAIQAGWNSRLAIRNSILWNPDANSLPEIVSDGSVAVTSSILRGGQYGAINQNPILAYGGWMTAGSPGLDAGVASGVARDVQGENRPAGAAPDLGWDELHDTDADGLPDWLEALGVADPSADPDGDGLSNLAEYQTHGTNWLTADTDGDGLSDGTEALTHGTNPLSADSDGDGMADGWEINFGLNPLANDAASDFDGDGLTNLWEFTNGYNPTDPSDSLTDSNQNGIADWWEITHFGALGVDPSADPDKDGLSNLLEFQIHTNPKVFDTDADGLPDGFEHFSIHLDPLVWNNKNLDSDGDGISDLMEAIYGLNPDADDSGGDIDQDGLSNSQEIAFGSSPLDADLDGDELNDLGEFQNQTNPWNRDTDSDSLPDGWEVRYGLNPKIWTAPDSDTDNDGLTLAQEARYGTNPSLLDTDADGTSDGQEVANNTDPTDPEWGGSPPSAPSQVSSTLNPDGSTTYTWQDNSSNEAGFRIRQKQADGTWTFVVETSANTTSFTTPVP
jgi:hypothetical protein